MNPWRSRQPAHKQIQAMRETAHSFRKSTAQRRLRSPQKIHTPCFFRGPLLAPPSTLCLGTARWRMQAVWWLLWPKLFGPGARAIVEGWTLWPGAAILVVADPAGGLPIGQVGFYPAG